jgi:hypothetical protein
MDRDQVIRLQNMLHGQAPCWENFCSASAMPAFNEAASPAK